ncbi:hypothetical protein GOV13_02625 [Candidatus Pacearchaeota archaeon]|nr:hypothetical protein [Candidatus Pacearchaeota archaeon]
MKCECCNKETDAEVCEPYCIPCGLYIEETIIKARNQQVEDMMNSEGGMQDALRSVRRETAKEKNDLMKEFLLDQYGEECKDYEGDCPTCEAWDFYKKRFLSVFCRRERNDF